MTRPGSPDGLAQLRADIIRWLDEDTESYGHIYGAGYEGRKGGRHRAAAICKSCQGRGWIDGEGEWRRCEQCTPAAADATGDITVNMMGVRGQLAEFTERLTRMWELAKGNRRVLRTAEDVLDRQADTETAGAELRRAARSTATEIAAARAAKTRRLKRGERLAGDGTLTPPTKFERVGLVVVDKDGNIPGGGVAPKHARYVMSEKDGEILLTPAASQQPRAS